MNALDCLFLERACELAERAIGDTSPNPPVGAVLVRDGVVIAEGYHHRAREPHAEANALREAGGSARGATLYVSLEPCNHTGRTPPCAPAIVKAGVTRVVVGACDPNPRTAGAGIGALEAAGIRVDEVRSERARALVERFAVAVTAARPFVTLKMASSLDGYIASKSGGQEWLTGEAARQYVREQRIAHDAVLVGAKTVRVDNPRLTVRPMHRRRREYVRIVACASAAVPVSSAVFAPEPGYARTIVLAPGAMHGRMADLESVADVVYAGAAESNDLDLRAALLALYARGIHSVLCEGGPTLASALLADGLVDRMDWLIAPHVLHGVSAVPALRAGPPRGLHFDRVESLGPDVIISGTTHHNV